MSRQDGTRRSYLSGLASLAVSRVRYRALNGGARQTLLTIVGVGLAVALLLSVTSVGLGLASQGAVQTSATDYWILPEQSQGSAVIGVSGTRFGQVHTATAKLTQTEGVAYATPVLVDMVRVQGGESNTIRRVFLVGVIPREEGGRVVGLPTDDLEPGDPYYANGSYNGTWTGQAVVSESAASAFNLSAGENLSVLGQGAQGQPLSVAEVSPAQAPGLAQFPVLVVHLSEAQHLAGAMRGDEADQFQVDTTDSSAKQALTGLYPRSQVVSRQEMTTHQLQSSDLPLAMSIAAGIIAVVVGVLTIVTTMGFEVADDADSRAVLAAMGVSRGTRLALVGVETLVTTFVGGLLGVGLWLGGLAVITTVGQYSVQVPVIVFEPMLGVYGVMVALAVGLVSLPVVLLFTRRGTLTEALPAR